MISLPLLALVCAPLSPHPHGTTYHVRLDGGSPAVCDGKTDAPAEGARDGACAWSHPADALPPGGAARLGAGDRLVVGPGHYRIGPEPLAPLPAGAGAEARTVLVGLPGAQLAGAGRVPYVLNLGGSSHVEVACLEITDASDCVDKHGGTLRCPGNADFAGAGLSASDAAGVVLRGIEIHGLASAGMLTARTSDWLLEDVTLARNGLVGWQAETAGATTLRRVAVEHNGCGEDGQRRPVGCASRTAGGWGAGVHVWAASGTWRVEDSRVSRNTGDGLTLLHDGVGSIVLRRLRAEGNAGVQVRARGEVLVEDNVVAARCRGFEGAPETFHVDACAGGGAALALEPLAARPLAVRGGTISGEGTSLLEVVVPVPDRGDKLRAGTPADVCRRLLPVKVTKTVWEGVGQPLYHRECGGLEGAGPALERVGGVVRRAR